MKKLNIHRIKTVVKKEFIHIRRDKASLIISFVLPIVMLMLFGFAVNTDVTDVQLGIYDASNTYDSHKLTNAFTRSNYFIEAGHYLSTYELEEAIKANEVKVGLIIPENFSRDFQRNNRPSIQILVDGSDPTIARSALQYSLLITNNYNYSLFTSNIIPGAAASPMVLYNPSLESARFNIPGVVGLVLQNLTIILTALAMVREKELGTMEQLIMTPVTSMELIIGKLFPYIFIGTYDYLVVMTLSYRIFGITVAGNLLELSLLAFIFLIGALSMGMLISTVAKNQGQAIQVTLAFLLPSVLLSGFIFPRETMPTVIQFISNVLPVTHFLIILRGIIVKGVSIPYLWNATVAMLVIIFVLIGITSIAFSKKLD